MEREMENNILTAKEWLEKDIVPFESIVSGVDLNIDKMERYADYRIKHGLQTVYPTGKEITIDVKSSCIYLNGCPIDFKLEGNSFRVSLKIEENERSK